jgi:hypothetical protein
VVFQEILITGYILPRNLQQVITCRGVSIACNLAAALIIQIHNILETIRQNKLLDCLIIIAVNKPVHLTSPKIYFWEVNGHYSTTRKVAGSIPDEVSFFSLILPAALGSGVY